jgi:hypothetical protein
MVVECWVSLECERNEGRSEREAFRLLPLVRCSYPSRRGFLYFLPMCGSLSAVGRKRAIKSQRQAGYEEVRTSSEKRRGSRFPSSYKADGAVEACRRPPTATCRFKQL